MRFNIGDEIWFLVAPDLFKYPSKATISKICEEDNSYYISSNVFSDKGSKISENEVYASVEEMVEKDEYYNKNKKR